jgi:hypothetical protein
MMTPALKMVTESVPMISFWVEGKWKRRICAARTEKYDSPKMLIAETTAQSRGLEESSLAMLCNVSLAYLR